MNDQENLSGVSISDDGSRSRFAQTMAVFPRFSLVTTSMAIKEVWQLTVA